MIKKSGRPAVGIEARADNVLKALTALGDGWHSRPEIAEAMGYQRMAVLEVQATQLLIASGKIEVRETGTTRRNTRGRSFAYEYRIADGKETTSE